MTIFELFTIIQSVVMAGATVLVAMLGRDRREMQAKIDAINENLKNAMPLDLAKQRLDEITKQLDRAGARYSSLASTVNGLPERMRAQFVSVERIEDLLRESREDRTRLWEALRKVSDIVDRRDQP